MALAANLHHKATIFKEHISHSSKGPLLMTAVEARVHSYHMVLLGGMKQNIGMSRVRDPYFV